MASAGGSCQEMEPAGDFAARARHRPDALRNEQSSPARNALSCHPPENRLRPRTGRRRRPGPRPSAQPPRAAAARRCWSREYAPAVAFTRVAPNASTVPMTASRSRASARACSRPAPCGSHRASANARDVGDRSAHSALQAPADSNRPLAFRRRRFELSVEQPVRRVPPGAVRADPRPRPKSSPSSRMSRRLSRKVRLVPGACESSTGAASVQERSRPKWEFEPSQRTAARLATSVRKAARSWRKGAWTRTRRSR
jgi:hypothetical protein